MSPTPSDEVVGFTLRLTREEHDRLRALADAGHRTLNAQVRMMLLEYVPSEKSAAA